MFFINALLPHSFIEFGLYIVFFAFYYKLAQPYMKAAPKKPRKTFTRQQPTAIAVAPQPAPKAAVAAKPVAPAPQAAEPVAVTVSAIVKVEDGQPVVETAAISPVLASIVELGEVDVTTDLWFGGEQKMFTLPVSSSAPQVESIVTAAPIAPEAPDVLVGPEVGLSDELRVLVHHLALRGVARSIRSIQQSRVWGSERKVKGVEISEMFTTLVAKGYGVIVDGGKFLLTKEIAIVTPDPAIARKVETFTTSVPVEKPARKPRAKSAKKSTTAKKTSKKKTEG